MGTGKVLASWSAAEGVKYRPCKRCDGTGERPNVRANRDRCGAAE
jgi:hypothetical protein